MNPKSSLFLFILCCLSLSVFSKSYPNLYEKMKEVNAQWAFQEDIPSGVYEMAPVLNETKAIQTHLKLVEETLRKRSVSHLSPAQQKNRIVCLDLLQGYQKAGKFPENSYLPYRNPVFIDKHNTFCAVGYLVKETGYESVSREISQTQNFAYVYGIKHETLPKWAEMNGFTLAELAWIQPGYPPVHPTSSMDSGLGGTVYDILENQMYPDNIFACGDFSDKVSLWYPGFAGYDWMGQANIQGGNVYAMAMNANGLPVIGGDFTSISGASVSRIAILAPTGMGYLPMGSLSGTVKDLIMYKNDMYAAGAFGVMKWDGTTWVPVYTPSSGSANVFHIWGDDLYIGGDFYENNYHNILRYDGNTLSPVGNGLENPVYAISHFKNVLFAGGMFDPGTNVGYLWKYENNQWDSTGESLTGNAIYALENVQDSVLYMGGDFNYFPIMGNWGVNLATVHPSFGYFYFNGLDEMDAPVRCIHSVGERIYVGGAFAGNGINNNLNGIGFFDFVAVTTDPVTEADFRLCPNPAQEKLVFTGSKWVGKKAQIIISDITGATLKEVEWMVESEKEINVDDLSAGVYLFTFLCENDKVVKKWQKQ